MGSIDKKIKELALEAGTVAATAVTGKISTIVEKIDFEEIKENHREKKEERPYKRQELRQKAIKKHAEDPTCAHLFMRVEQGTVYFNGCDYEYIVFDEDQNLKYRATGANNYKVQVIKIFDAKGKEVACIREQRIPFKRLVKSGGDYLSEFTLIVGRNKLGRVTNKLHYFKGDTINVKYNGWKILWSIRGSSIVDEEGRKIAFIAKRILQFKMFYFIDYEPNVNELLIVMMAMLIRAFDQSAERRANRETLSGGSLPDSE